MKTQEFFPRCFEITDAPGLDPIRVILQNLGEKQGRLIIECYGRAWSTFWGGMSGPLIDFILKCEPEYIENALHRGQAPNKRERQYLLRIIQAVQSALRTIPPTWLESVIDRLNDVSVSQIPIANFGVVNAIDAITDEMRGKLSK